MRYSNIFAKFLMLFPQYADLETAISWLPAGKDTIQVKLRDGSGLAFTYISDTVWTLESSNGFPVKRG